MPTATEPKSKWTRPVEGTICLVYDQGWRKCHRVYRTDLFSHYVVAHYHFFK